MYKKAGRLVGGCSAFLIVGSIGSAFGWLARNDWFVLVLIAFILTGSWLGGTLLGVFERMLKPDLDLEIRLAERKKAAARKGVREAAAAVVNFLGDDGRFCDNVLDIQFEKQGSVTKATIRCLQSGHWQIVFEGERRSGASAVSERMVLSPLESGGYELGKVYDSSSKADDLSVEGYIPGEWEIHLKALERKAQQVAATRREQSDKADLRKAQEQREEERRKFGL